MKEGLLRALATDAEVRHTISLVFHINYLFVILQTGIIGDTKDINRR